MFKEETIVCEDSTDERVEKFTYVSEMSLYNWLLSTRDCVDAINADYAMKGRLSNLIIGVEQYTTSFTSKGLADYGRLAEEEISASLALLENCPIDSNYLNIKGALQKITDIVNQTDTFTVQAFSLIRKIALAYDNLSARPTSRLFAIEFVETSFRIDKDAFFKVVAFAIDELEEFFKNTLLFYSHGDAVKNNLSTIKNDLSKLEAHYLIGAKS